ncbi:MAG: hypothetical protein EXQ52_18205 [Bryobacterales bacterium]|nr:hypothetical protein [Bryobacterales bacterium]
MKPPIERVSNAEVYCPIRTHIVNADIALTPKKPTVLPGQKCSRCWSSLDAGFVMVIPKAA